MCIFSAKNSSQIEYVQKTRRSIDVSHCRTSAYVETLEKELCELYPVKVQQENTKSTRGAKAIRGPHNYFFHSWISSLFFTLQFNRMSFIRTSWPWNIWKKVFFLQPFAESSSPKFIVARLQSRTEIFSSPFFSDVVGVKQSGFFFPVRYSEVTNYERARALRLWPQRKMRRFQCLNLYGLHPDRPRTKRCVAQKPPLGNRPHDRMPDIADARTRGRGTHAQKEGIININVYQVYFVWISWNLEAFLFNLRSSFFAYCVHLWDTGVALHGKMSIVFVFHPR